MNTAFQSERRDKVYRTVIKCLRDIGYASGLIQEDYIFNDWFSADSPRRDVCAVFGQTPLSYDSACFGILPTSLVAATPASISSYRSLGAPIMIEIREDGIVPWRVGRDAQNTNQFVGRIPINAIERAFAQRKAEWGPEALLRAKNIGQSIGSRQLDSLISA